MDFLWNNWIINSAIFLIFITYVFYRYMIRNFDYWWDQNVVFVPPTPIVGNFGDFLMRRQSAGQFMKEIYDYAPNEPFVGFFGFDKPMLMIRDPELIKHILIKDFEHFRDRYARAGDHDILGGANLFAVRNPAWKYLRGKLSAIYTTAKLKKMVELMVEVGQDLVTHIESLELKESGRTIDVKELSTKFTTDMIATTVFGLRANCLNNPEAEFRICGKNFFTESVYRKYEQMALFFAPHLMTPLRLDNFPKKFSDFMRSIVWEAINDREKTGVIRNDVIDLLIELKNGEENNPDRDIFEFKGDNLVAQAAVFFVGGFETTATALSFTLYELAVNPEIQSRLRREITDAVNDNRGEITYEMIMKLPYLDMVVLESLRKYPPFPLLERVAVLDYQVPDTDLIIEKGTPIYISLMGLHYDPNYHDNPEEFNPERFSDANKESTKKAWYPFGDGPHVCIGQRLGLLEVKLGIINILQGYEISPGDKTTIPMKLTRNGMNTAVEGGVHLNIKKIAT